MPPARLAAEWAPGQGLERATAVAGVLPGRGWGLPELGDQDRACGITQGQGRFNRGIPVSRFEEGSGVTGLGVRFAQAPTCPIEAGGGAGRGWRVLTWAPAHRDAASFRVSHLALPRVASSALLCREEGAVPKPLASPAGPPPAPRGASVRRASRGAGVQPRPGTCLFPAVSQASLLRLYHRFRALDRNKKGYLSRMDLQQIGALAVNPLGDRIIDSFFPDGSQRVDFSGFVRVLAHFRPVDEEEAGIRDPKQPEPLNSRMNKLRFAFQLYDLDRDGKISRHEMLQVLRLMVGVQVTEEQLESIADRTVQEADEDGDGAVSFLEFTKSLEKMNIEQKMSIRILK